MRKILITGSPGSGKTTLSRRISKKLALPLHHMDLIYWKPGWKRPDPQESSEMIDAILAQDAWIVDGVSERIFDAADTIIFLDVSRRIAYWRLLKRFFVYSFRRRTEVPERSSELRIFRKAVRVIRQFPTRHRPGILQSMQEVADVKSLVHIRSNAELQDFLKSIFPS